MTTHSDIITGINNSLDQIHSEEELVRKHINTTRYQSELLKNSDNWNQICSSLDAIGDTAYSINDYLTLDFPESTGLKYILTYGVLQSLFIQQDAVRHLAEAFGVSFDLSDKMRNIRRIRNASIGHPTKNNVNGVTHYNYISRISMTKYGFTLMRSSENDRSEFLDINLLSIINDQLNEIKKSYGQISAKLVEVDRMHREKHKTKPLADIFHSSMGYTFSKVAEGIHSPEHSRTFGLTMLNSIEETYNKFEKELENRKELSQPFPI